MTMWEVLGIKSTTDERVIKKAYAKQTRIHHPEADPEGFQLLYKAYQRAMEMAKASKSEVEHNSCFNNEIELDLEVNGNKKKQDYEEAQSQEKNSQKLQDELLFSSLINYVDLEKREYYNSAAMVDFIRIFSNKAKVYHWEPWKQYVESTTFLKAQYDKKFIRYLADFLMEQQYIEVRKLPKNLFYELCTAYGIMTDDEVYNEDYVKPLIDVMYQNYMHFDHSYMMTRQKSILDRRYAFYIYRNVLREAEKDASDQTMNDWIRILEDATYEISQKAEDLIKITHNEHDLVYLQIERSPLVFELLTIFLEMHDQITKEMYYALYQLFEIQDIQNGGDELEIMLLTLQEKSSPEILQYIEGEARKSKEHKEVSKNDNSLYTPDITISPEIVMDTPNSCDKSDSVDATKNLNAVKSPGNRTLLKKQMKQEYIKRFIPPAILCLLLGTVILLFGIIGSVRYIPIAVASSAILLSVGLILLYFITKFDCFRLLKEYLIQNSHFMMEDLEKDFCEAERFGPRFWVGRHWTFYMNELRLPNIIDNKKIIWTYYQAKSNNRGYLYVYSRRDKVIIPIECKYFEEILRLYNKNYTHILIGYSEEREQIFRNDLDQFVNLLRQ